ncbi:hypothetical protein [Alkalinema sp. FACHB-956]|uniref:hypothetical protein n=1 Tax=Alkalinema sp. FACHB-956 TaxID=2692768 RepID=UPI0016821080|nr:hypothetical protein [Alkalinema sp. FACHB-956]MBD2329432.1 hypothetical protein [Alkalinema sp. FACHB-956]
MSFSSPPNGPSPHAPEPIRPLSVGNVVSAAFRLYRANFQQYLGIAWQATLWVVVPLLLLLVPAVYIFSQARSRASAAQSLGLFWLIMIVWIVIYLYCLSSYLAHSAAITRLVHSELLGQPEDPKAVQRITQSRRGSFLGSGFLIGLLVGGISFLVAIAFFIITAVVAGSSGAIRFSAAGRPIANDPAMALLVGVLFLLGLVLWATWLTWMSARFLLPEVAIAVEDNVGAVASLGRSWNLTQRNAWRIVGILIVAFLVTLPIQILLQIISEVVNKIVAVSFPSNSPSYAVITAIVGMILGFVVSAFILPYWQAIKAVIYYDLRSRREGIGLTLRDR